MLSDFHCHTHFSVDGHPSPEALLEAALARGVRLLSITEHNTIASLPRASRRARELGIEYFPGVELDLFWQGRQLHMLAYGFDPANARLKRLLERHIAVYRSLYPHLLCEMEERGLPVDRDRLAAAKRRRYPTYFGQVDNLWFWKQRFKGDYPESLLHEITQAARRRAARDGDGAAPAHFAHFEEVRDCIHEAGGLLLLAHVGRYFADDVESQVALLEDLLDAGMDGFELYHPHNCRQADFPLLERFARERTCLLSGGSDTHSLESAIRLGNPTSLGCMSTPGPLLQPLLQQLRERQPAHASAPA